METATQAAALTAPAPPTAASQSPAPTGSGAAPQLAPIAAAARPSASPFDREWRRWLHDGLIPNTAFAAKTVTLQPAITAQPLAQAAGPGLEVVFRPDPSVHDGRFTNNAWLQELPKSLTKLTWDNAALVSPHTAETLHVENGDILEVRHEGRMVRVPAWITPGQAPDALTIHVGYGRSRAGRVGNGAGFAMVFALLIGAIIWNLGSRNDYTKSEDDTVLVNGIAADPHALGRFARRRRGENAAMLEAMSAFRRLFGDTRPAVRLLRNIGVRAVDRIGPLTPAFMRRAMGLE